MKVVTKIRHDLSEPSVRLMANEQSMLKYVAQLGLSLVERLQYSFQDNNALYLATVRHRVSEQSESKIFAVGFVC